MVYHPQTDGQMERINQVTESYLTSYGNVKQYHWRSTPAMAECSSNNYQYSAPKTAHRYAYHGFEAHKNWPTPVQFRNPSPEIYCHSMTSVHSKLSKQLEQSMDAMRK